MFGFVPIKVVMMGALAGFLVMALSLISSKRNLIGRSYPAKRRMTMRGVSAS